MCVHVCVLVYVPMRVYLYLDGLGSETGLIVEVEPIGLTHRLQLLVATHQLVDEKERKHNTDQDESEQI